MACVWVFCVFVSNALISFHELRRSTGRPFVKDWVGEGKDLPVCGEGLVQSLFV